MLGRYELESQCACLRFQSFFDVLRISFFVFSEDAFIVCLPSGQEVINDASEFMGCCRYCLWWPQFGTHAPIVLAEGAMAMM